MQVQFDERLASALQEFVTRLRGDDGLRAQFIENPTAAATSFLQKKGATVPTTFHAHAVSRGNPLPEEPRLATVDRFIYIFRKDGLFEFKQVPGSPDGDDAVLSGLPHLGACACCNCCAVEI